MTRLLLFRASILSVVSVGFALPGYAQTLDTVSPQTYDPPAHVSFVEGRATLEREGSLDEEPRNMPLVAGDRVRTQNGRVEILFADGSTLHLDAHTAVDFQSDELIRLLDGRIRLSIPGPDPGDVYYRIDAASGWAQITAPGEYRLSIRGDARSPELELAVLRGQASLLTEAGQTPLRAGERAFVRAGAAPSYAYVFNSASWDAFDEWSEARRSHRANLSTQYLPSEVQRYAQDFDHHGDWRRHPEYGQVWYPHVAVEWRPYYHGRWVTLPVYGWTWVGRDPWAWPTHHYGRWGFAAGTWFWIPGRSWAPAWVAWAYAPGYVSWSPLGWNNRPLIQINLFGRSRDHWHPWTFVPHSYFGRGYVHGRAVHYWNIDANVRRSFAHGVSAPSYTARPRGAPIRVAGRSVGTAVPRGSQSNSAPLYTNRGADGRRTNVMTGPTQRATPQAGSRPSPDRARPSVPATRSVERPGVVPRGTASGADRAARPEAGAPVRSAVPGSRPRPQSERSGPGARAPEPARSSRPDAAAVPPTGSRPSGGAVQRSAPAPSRSPGGAVQRSAPAPSRSNGGAVQRSAPAPSRPPGGAVERSAPAPSRPSGGAVERSAPAPSRSSAPAARPSGGSSGGGSSAEPRSRSRGEQPARGAARPRGGQ